MLKGKEEVIRTRLSVWEGHNGLKRYYYNDWTRYCKNGELESYELKYHVNPTDSKVGIKVFFDGDGVLHINNCHDPDLKAFLEYKMEGWYRWVENKFNETFMVSVKVIDLIRAYVTEFKPGMFRVDYNGKFFIFDSEYMAHLKWTVYAAYDRRNGNCNVDTGYPKLDAIVRDIMQNYEEWSDRQAIAFNQIFSSID